MEIMLSGVAKQYGKCQLEDIPVPVFAVVNGIYGYGKISVGFF